MLCVAYSPDGRLLACGTMDGTVAVFDAATAALLHSLPGRHLPVRSLAFLADCATLVVACDDGRVALYDAPNGALLEELAGHKPGSWVLAVAARPDGGSFATGGSDGSVRLWDVSTRSLAQALPEAHANLVWGLAFSPDGSRLVSGSDDKSLALFGVS